MHIDNIGGVLKKALTVIILILVVICLYYKYLWNSFPGRFYIANADGLCATVYVYERHHLGELAPSGPEKMVLHGRTPYLTRPDDGFLKNLSVSPDGKVAAYLQPGMHNIVIRRADQELNAPSIQEEYAYWAEKKYPVLKYLNIEKFNIAGSENDNLVWSPDGKALAYADYDKLYIVNVDSGAVSVAALPHDADLDKYYQCWLASEKATPLPEPLKIPGLSDYLKDEYHRNLIDDDPMSKAWITADNMCDHNPVPFSKTADSIYTQDVKRVRRALGVRSAIPIDAEDSWNGYYAFRTSVRNDVVTWHRDFRYTGRVLSWARNNTIYCDNWRLEMRCSGGKYSVASVMKTPLVCAMFVRPYWNPAGDKAAYRIYAGSKIELVVVNQNSKILWRQETRAINEPVHWSHDGRYIAASCADEKLNLVFGIYEVGTSRKWIVPLPAPLRDRRPEKHDAVMMLDWDWRY